MNNLRKTHPMVLVAAATLTLFSLLGSAAITGLLPNASGKQEPAAFEDQTGAVDQHSADGKASDSDDNARHQQNNKSVACMNCGTIVAILALEGEISSVSGNKEYRMAPAYQIKVRMNNGTYQTLVQQKRPKYLIGDVIRLERRQATV